MALTDPKVREVVAHKDQYPEELIELLKIMRRQQILFWDIRRRRIRRLPRRSVMSRRGRFHFCFSGMSVGVMRIMRTT